MTFGFRIKQTQIDKTIKSSAIDSIANNVVFAKIFYSCNCFTGSCRMTSAFILSGPSWYHKTSLSPSVKLFLLTVPVLCIFVDHCCYLGFVSVMLSYSFIVALWSPAGKGLTSWLSCVRCFFVFLSLSHVVSWVSCGT